MQRTLVLIKPDAVERALVGEIIGRMERKGLRLVAARLLRPSRALAEQHYAAHRTKPFFGGLIDFLASGPVLAMVWEGPRAIDQVRALMGATDPLKSAPGSIRGDLALDIGNNLIHGSDSEESAAQEIELWFAADDVLHYRRSSDGWVQGAE